MLKDFGLGCKVEALMAGTTAATERLERLQRQKAAIEAKIARLNAQQSAQQRRIDTRRKIIAGALALAHCAFDQAFRDTMMTLFDSNLVKPADRALFNLPPRPEVSTNESDTSNPAAG
jgi:hypothetical protein